MIVSENYLDPDVAYFLGLISARGAFHESAGDKKIIIHFPFGSFNAQGVTIKFQQKTHLDIGVNQIRDRIYELVESDISITKTASLVIMSIRFLRHSMTWRVVKYHFPDGDHYHEFQVPQAIFAAPQELQREYLRGFADAAGYARESNYDQGGRRRIYLEVANRNWTMPVQLCRLLQRHLKVPVHAIQWGHPNTREPNQPHKGTTWAREHQVKIYAEAFLPVGFYVEYKQEILEDLAADNIANHPGTLRFCNPNPAIRRITPKLSHPEEGNERIPDAIRSAHFDAYWEICLGMGCDQLVKIKKTQRSFLDPDGDE